MPKVIKNEYSKILVGKLISPDVSNSCQFILFCNKNQFNHIAYRKYKLSASQVAPLFRIILSNILEFILNGRFKHYSSVCLSFSVSTFQFRSEFPYDFSTGKIKSVLACAVIPNVIYSRFRFPKYEAKLKKKKEKKWLTFIPGFILLK